MTTRRGGEQAAVIADIVGSRRLPDRATAQRALDETIASVDAAMPLARTPLRPVVGDEQQGLYPTVAAAMAATLILRLALPEGLDLRFGIGRGVVETLPGPAGDIPEGPGWWAAREAIDHVHTLQKRNAPHARTWLVAARDDAEGMSDAVRYANAYLLARDQVIGAMSDRGRRLTLGRLYGRSQRELADSEGITQSAVSQALAAAGAGAIVEGFDALLPGART